MGKKAKFSFEIKIDIVLQCLKGETTAGYEAVRLGGNPSCELECIVFLIHIIKLKQQRNLIFLINRSETIPINTRKAVLKVLETSVENVNRQMNELEKLRAEI